MIHDSLISSLPWLTSVPLLGCKPFSASSLVNIIATCLRQSDFRRFSCTFYYAFLIPCSMLLFNPFILPPRYRGGDNNRIPSHSSPTLSSLMSPHHCIKIHCYRTKVSLGTICPCPPAAFRSFCYNLNFGSSFLYEPSDKYARDERGPDLNRSFWVCIFANIDLTGW